MHHDQNNKLKNDGRLEKLIISFNSQPNEHVIGSFVPLRLSLWLIPIKYFSDQNQRESDRNVDIK